MNPLDFYTAYHVSNLSEVPNQLSDITMNPETTGTQGFPGETPDGEIMSSTPYPAPTIIPSGIEPLAALNPQEINTLFNETSSMPNFANRMGIRECLNCRQVFPDTRSDNFHKFYLQKILEKN